MLNMQIAKLFQKVAWSSG